MSYSSWVVYHSVLCLYFLCLVNVLWPLFWVSVCLSGLVLFCILLYCSLEFFCFNLIHYVFCFLNILRNVPVHGTGSPEERRTGSYILHHPGRQAGCPTVEVTPGPSKGVELPWAHRARLQGGISGSPYWSDAHCLGALDFKLKLRHLIQTG